MKITRLLILLTMLLSGYVLTGCTGCSEDQLDPANQASEIANNDIDGDGIIDTEDDDIDGDGIANADDDDLDGDGIDNEYDNDLDGDGVSNSEDTDIDGDGISNGADNDDDGDGIDDSDDDTPNGDENSYITVRINDTVTFDFELPEDGNDEIEKTEEIDTDDIRDELDDAGISPENFDITGIRVSATDKVNDFLSENSDKRVVIKFYVDGELAITSPEEADLYDVITLQDLKDEVSLNNGLYISNPGFSDFVDVIKDNAKSSSDIKMVLVPVDEFSTDLDDAIQVQFILETATRSAL